MASVRRGGPDDWAQLRAIRLEALADTPEAYGAHYQEVVRWSAQRWRDVAAQWHYYLGDVQGEVVGMISARLTDEAPLAGWLYSMYVAPRARGTGLADSLVDAVTQWVRSQGARELYLQVTSSVARARVFYERCGFRPTADTTAMERDPSLVLITMVRPLVNE